MNPSLKDQLQEWKKKNSIPAKKNMPQQKSQEHRIEHLSEDDIKYLMGVNMPVMKRGKGGAWRNGR